MIQIVKVTLREIALNLVEPFQISSGTVTQRRIFLLESETSDGLTVWSECVAGEKPNYSPEIIDTAWIIVRDFLWPLVKNTQFKHPQDISPHLDSAVKGNFMAKSALEMAGWCIAATQNKQSLAAYIGGQQKTIPTGLSIGIQDSPEILAQKARAAVDKGYKKIKIKIKPGHDINYVKAVCEKIGNDALIMVDANNAYSLDDISILKQLDTFNLVMIEQPLAWDDVLEHGKLQSQINTPICLDESITTRDRAKEMINNKSGKIINIKPGRIGGFAEALAIHDLCEKHDIPVWCGGMLESGIGRSYNVALASLPNFTLPGDLSPSNRYWAQDIITPEWTMDKNGMMAVPFDKIGLGVDINKDFIDTITVRKEIIS